MFENMPVFEAVKNSFRSVRAIFCVLADEIDAAQPDPLVRLGLVLLILVVSLPMCYYDITDSLVQAGLLFGLLEVLAPICVVGMFFLLDLINKYHRRHGDD